MFAPLEDHVSYGHLTMYGLNTAMHGALSYWTRRFGYVCFKPTSWTRSRGWRRWYFYVSPNHTPWASTFAIGPGVSRRDKAGSVRRRRLWGHRFDTDLHDAIKEANDYEETG